MRSAIGEVLTHLRAQTGHDFSHYKRATVLRRIARRLQVNSLESIPQYLEFLRKHPAEARALLQDLLIGVTHFFRDRESFAALEANIPQLFAGKKQGRSNPRLGGGLRDGRGSLLDRDVALRTCRAAGGAAGDSDLRDATSTNRPSQDARDGLYPTTIEADVSPERLRRFFRKDHGRYRVRKDLREKVLFAAHNLLKDAPFSRLDLVSCRNLLIYLNAQSAGPGLRHFPFRAARRRSACSSAARRATNRCAIALLAGGRKASALSCVARCRGRAGKFRILPLRIAGREPACHIGAHGARCRRCCGRIGKAASRNARRLRRTGTPRGPLRRAASEVARAIRAALDRGERSPRHRAPFRERRTLSAFRRGRADSESFQGGRLRRCRSNCAPRFSAPRKPKSQ